MPYGSFRPRGSRPRTDITVAPEIRSAIQLGVMTEQILVVEGQPTARGDVVRDSRPIEDNVVQRAQPRAVAKCPPAGRRAAISQTRTHLRHRQVRVAQACPDHSGPPRTARVADTPAVA